MTTECPLCKPDREGIWFENQTGLVSWDAFPISQGHALVIPKRHVATMYDLPMEMQTALWMLVAEVRNRLKEELRPDGLNIGLNDGEAAGQTVMHAHIHIIPRWNGDVPDPRGGIRWIIPDKAQYWGDE